jgi:SAGA-associated factor 73
LDKWLGLILITASTAAGTDDETPVKVTPRKESKDGVIRPNGTIKLKRPAPKHNKPGNWRDGSVVDG